MLTKITITIETEDAPISKPEAIDKLMGEMTEDELDKAINDLISKLFR